MQLEPSDRVIGRDPATHRCKPYLNSRGEIIDPACQAGIGCQVCNPPDGRITKGGSNADRA